MSSPDTDYLRHMRDEVRYLQAQSDRVIHDYLGVDYEIVWDVVRNKIPVLKIELERILAAENEPAAEP